ncbi:MAG TPA: DUF1684 domain-containing protein [Thermoanaerobaculia bacterium]|jgi:hypothetical protein
MKRALALSLTLLMFACAEKPEKPAPQENATVHQDELEKWRTNRIARLTSDDGWLTLVGLFWLKEGPNRFGSDKDANDIVMPAKAPASAGTLTLEKGGRVTLTPSAPMTVDGKPASGTVELRPDTHKDGPSIVQLGSMRFQIIERVGRYGVRLKDPESDARKNFAGIEMYPPSAKWRVEATFEPYNPPKKIAITNIIGQVEEMVSPGALVFAVDGQTYRLDPVLEEGSEDYFLIFKDATSRDTTYPAGRYLYAAVPKNGKTIVDFNKAYNPPCAFTNFATCPLPPPQNRLAVRVEAGEKNYGHH